MTLLNSFTQFLIDCVTRDHLVSVIWCNGYGKIRSRHPTSMFASLLQIKGKKYRFLNIDSPWWTAYTCILKSEKRKRNPFCNFGDLTVLQQQHSNKRYLFSILKKGIAFLKTFLQDALKSLQMIHFTWSALDFFGRKLHFPLGLR